MMPTLINPQKILFGVVQPLPLKGFPEGKTKISVRSDDFVTVFVRTGNSIRQFCVKEEGGFWIPSYEQKSNYKQ